ncbi:TonB-dependent receptor [Algibacillus agarilyticus]|uniref:TonB-dependent receptor n=1 Tax=Algibacillus agarilyticus TaxID=2234133 RepID=UPI000DD035FB|nr:TonB-dependent receptor [Algibacillus agarilyticus]
MKTKSVLITSSLLATSSVLLVNANEQDNKSTSDIERIQILGDFRDNDVLRASSSISVLNNQVIERRTANHLEEIFSAAPNLTYSSGSSRARYFQIRGIGISGEFADPVLPSVGLIIDNVDFTGIGSGATLYDMAQAEIYRGPQGTRFGANALAGMIYLESKPPTEKTEANITLGMGNYSNREVAGSVSTAITDTITARFAAHKYHSNGFIKNTHLGRTDTNDRDEVTLRSKFRWQADADTQVDVSLFHINIKNGYDAFSLDNTRETLSDQPGKDTQKTNAASVFIDHVLNDAVRIQAISSYADSNIQYGYDEDWSFVGIDPDWEYSAIDNYTRGRENVVGEIRALSEDQGRLFADTTDWIAGIYYKKSVEDLQRQQTDLASDYYHGLESEKYALFGQLDTQVNDVFSTEFGLRFEKHNDNYRNSDAYFVSPTYNMWGGKFVANFKISEDEHAYASINRGYKVGGFNVSSSITDQAERQFSPEYLWNFEVGYKFDFPQHNAWLNTALFTMERYNVQVQDDKEIIRENSSTEFISVTGNADVGFSRGVELEMGWQPHQDITLFGSLGLLKAKFEGYTTVSGQQIQTEELSHSPSYTYSLGTKINLTDKFDINIEVEGKDDYRFSDSDHDTRSVSYNLIHLSLNYQLDDWLIKLWARNLNDTDYYVRGFGSFGNDPRKEYMTEPYFQYGERHTWGLKAEYTF